MENDYYEEFNHLKLNLSQIPTFNTLSSTETSLLPNYDYFKKNFPYMNFQLMRKILKEQSMQTFPEYFSKKKSEIKNTFKEALKSDLNEFKDNKYLNINLNESPLKSTFDDSKSKISIKDKNIKKNKNHNDNNNKERNNYIDLLINTVNNLFEKGEINTEYLNSKTYPKFDPNKFCLTLKNNYYMLNKKENSYNNFSKKCDNKICTYLADDPHKLFQAKFYTSNIYKAKHLWLCEKCYKAFNLQNYCYYCHTVYRDYDHGTQYYDRKKWIQCDFCMRWHHMLCEEKKGKYQNIEDLSMNNNFKYMCPFCRKEQKSILRQKHINEKIKKNNENNNINNKYNSHHMKKFLNIKRKGNLMNDIK